MIVEPDFLDHWKTRLLIDELGDESAPLYLLRLWAHCQLRRKDTFELSPSALKALCHFAGHSNKLEAALVTSGFVRREDSRLTVLNWSEYNAKLLANWSNGKKGGRPRNPIGNPDETDENPIETDKRRVDERRVDETKGGNAPLNPRPIFHQAFETFWKTYPATRRSKKQRAYKAWQAAGKRLVLERGISKPEAVTMLQVACEAFAASPVGQGPYCPGPAPWLSDGRYDDDPSAWNVEQPNGRASATRKAEPLPFFADLGPDE